MNTVIPRKKCLVLRICKQCGERKPLAEFHWRNREKQIRHWTCKTCWHARSAKWARENPERARELYRKSHRARRYAEVGISEEGYQELLKRQGGKCAICRVRPGKDRLAVDHDHQTGEIRGLLCKHCNQGLGHFRDDPQRLKRAVRYLTAQITLS